MNLVIAMVPALPAIAAVLRQSTPLILAAQGGILSERVGVINIALEGMMTMGAFTGMWAAQSWGSWAGLAAALVAGGSMGVLHFVLTQRFRMDHVISGVALNILAASATTYLMRCLFSVREANVSHPISVGWFMLAAFVLPPALHLFMTRSRTGLRMRAVGESPEGARMAGINTYRMRVIGVTFSGIVAGGAGAYLSMAQVGRFSDGMVSGRGFIALAAVICGRWRPVEAAATALVFGAFDSLQYQLQGNVQLPGELLRSLPYIVTILVAMLIRTMPPAALGRSEQEE
ncbi:MAG: ABC transporter permease [Chthonomonadales bacterium]